MRVWAWSAGAGVAIGVTVFLLVLVPILVWQYRSYGRLSVGRLFGAAVVSVYASALMAYTQLPLPQTRSLAWCEAYGVQSLQLTPFESFNTMIMRASEIGWGAMLTSTLGLQVIFNIALFLPLGIIVRGYFRTSIGVATLTGAFTSLMVEVTQATGLWGLYPCAYRLGDVDDLITNTLGAFLGAVIAPVMMFWLPKRRNLQAEKLTPRPVTAGRRILAMFVNYGLVWGVSTVAVVLVTVVWRLIDGKVNVVALEWVQFIVQAMSVVCVIFIPAIRGRGSLGMSAVWIRPVWRDASGWAGLGSLWKRIARASVLGIPLILTGMAQSQFAVTVFVLLAVVSFVMTPFTHTHRSLSGWITRAEIVDTRLHHGRVGGRR